MFPEAQLDSYSHAGFGKFFDVLLINKQSIDRIRGLVKTTNVNPGVIYKNQIPVIGKEENFVGNSVYKGKVFIPYYSACSFSNTGTANADFVINGFKLGSAGEIKLAKGFNNITIRVNSDEPGSTLYPVMKCSRYTGNSKGFQEVYPLNDRNLYSIPDSGLMFTVYSGDKWKGFPISSQEIIPVPFLNRFIGNALAARFSGYYNAGAEGVYKFNVSTNGFCAILIDGLQYWDNMSGLTINENIYSPGMKKVNDFKLTKGKHKIDIFIYNSSQFFMQSSFNNGEFKDKDFDALTPELFSAELK